MKKYINCCLYSALIGVASLAQAEVTQEKSDASVQAEVAQEKPGDKKMRSYAHAVINTFSRDAQLELNLIVKNMAEDTELSQEFRHMAQKIHQRNQDRSSRRGGHDQEREDIFEIAIKATEGKSWPHAMTTALYLLFSDYSSAEEVLEFMEKANAIEPHPEYWPLIVKGLLKRNERRFKEYREHGYGCNCEHGYGYHHTHDSDGSLHQE